GRSRSASPSTPCSTLDCSAWGDFERGVWCGRLKSRPRVLGPRGLHPTELQSAAHPEPSGNLERSPKGFTGVTGCRRDDTPIEPGCSRSAHMRRIVLASLVIAPAVLALGSTSASAWGWGGYGYGRGCYAPRAYYGYG